MFVVVAVFVALAVVVAAMVVVVALLLLLLLLPLLLLLLVPAVGVAGFCCLSLLLAPVDFFDCSCRFYFVSSCFLRGYCCCC